VGVLPETATDVLAVLFAGFGSTSFALTITVSVSVPGAAGVAWKFAMKGSVPDSPDDQVQLIAAPPGVHLGIGKSAEKKLSVAPVAPDKVAVAVTPVAPCGPWLNTSTRNITGWPVTTVVTGVPGGA
jgi:hypothetical protein